MSHLSQEDLDAIKDGYLEHKGYFNDALDVADKLVPDMLIAPRTPKGLPQKLDCTMHSDEYYALAKAILEVADSRKWLEREEAEMKKAGLGDQL
jgi:hypothetical protein